MPLHGVHCTVYSICYKCILRLLGLCMSLRKISDYGWGRGGGGSDKNAKYSLFNSFTAWNLNKNGEFKHWIPPPPPSPSLPLNYIYNNFHVFGGGLNCWTCFRKEEGKKRQKIQKMLVCSSKAYKFWMCNVNHKIYFYNNPCSFVWIRIRFFIWWIRVLKLFKKFK